MSGKNAVNAVNAVNIVNVVNVAIRVKYDPTTKLMGLVNTLSLCSVARIPARHTGTHDIHDIHGF